MTEKAIGNQNYLTHHMVLSLLGIIGFASILLHYLKICLIRNKQFF